jgi:glycosyltransferase involved in cell wall biosynthesis
VKTKSYPRISVVTPSYNQGDYVEWTVRSVLEQRYPGLEYILLDGGSTDSSIYRLRPYIDKFSFYQSAPDGGQSDAIAKGFSISTGDIMAYLNSDDMLLPGTLNYVAHFFEHNPSVDFIYGHRCIIDAHNKIIGHWILPPHNNFMMRRWDLIPQESCFWRRSLFEKYGNIDKALQFAMDYDLFVRFMRTGRFRRVDRFLSAFRIHQAAKTTNLLSSVGTKEVKIIQRRHQIRLIPAAGNIFSMSVQLRSALWLRRRKCLPGLPPGLGLSLDKLWGW